MFKPILLTLATGVLLTTAAVGQQPRPTPPTPQRPATTPPPPQPVVPSQTPAQESRRETAQQVNVRIELTITDQTGPGEPSKKVVTMLVADQRHSFIRTSGWIVTTTGRRDVNINVDAGPQILKDGAIRLDLALEYQPRGSTPPPEAAAGNAEHAQTTLTERISTILENGKPLIISQAADPVQDRRISIEAKATIAK